MIKYFIGEGLACQVEVRPWPEMQKITELLQKAAGDIREVDYPHFCTHRTMLQRTDDLREQNRNLRDKLETVVLPEAE